MSNSNKILDIISKEANIQKFAKWSYAKVSNLQEYENYFYKSLNNDMFAQMDYLKRNISKRFNPAELVEGCKSVLVFLAPFGSNGRINKNLDLNIKGEVTDNYVVSQYALGEDYHKVIQDKLNIILSKIKDEFPSITGRVFTDTAPIYERGWGVESGLGFIGKNNFLISRECGIRNFIGIILINHQFESYPQPCNDNFCGSCTNCIEACPTNALESPFSINCSKCLSYITIVKKGSNIYEIGRASCRERVSHLV